MRFNNKGALMYELLLSFVIVSIITIFAMNLILNFKSSNNRQNIISEVVLNKISLTKMIEDDLIKDVLLKINKIDDYTYTFYFRDKGEKTLSIDTQNNIFQYGVYKKKLKGDSVFKTKPNYITVDKTDNVDEDKNNSILIINIPITNVTLNGDLDVTLDKNLDKNYGIHIVYQYNYRVNDVF